MNFYENWIEQDLNPIISFTSSGKISFSNPEAQFLLSRISPKEIFDLALKYAPKSFGFETTYINLPLKSYSFYAISVRYENEDEIHIKLYKSTSVKQTKKLSVQNSTITNLFTLVDLAISTRKTKSDIRYIKSYDPSIPDLKLNAPSFLKLLNSVYDVMKDASNITTAIKIKIGEYIKVGSVKHSLVNIEISSDADFYVDFKQLNQNDDDFFILSIEDNVAKIDFPMIL